MATPASSPDPAPLTWVRTTTRLLDDQFRVPGTSWRFGLDFLLGLVPGAGDALSFAVSGVLVLTMVRYGASGMLAVKMIGNLLIDAVFGSIPLLGNLFDFSFKANRRNLRLLDQYHAEGRHRGSAWWVVGAVLGLLLAIMLGLVYFAYLILQWLFA